MTSRKIHILIGATGSVASIKIPVLVRLLLQVSISSGGERRPYIHRHSEGAIFSFSVQQDENFEVKIVPTVAATHFFKAEEVSDVEVLTDADEWKVRLLTLSPLLFQAVALTFLTFMWSKKTDPVLHIELRNWADILLLSPLDANTLAKIANGLCDNLLTCILRAWDPLRPVIACPAMNTNMWEHPFTAKHLSVLTEALGFRIVAPIQKLLACGDLGIGAMAEPETIVKYMRQVLAETKMAREARTAEDIGGDA
ncbi:LOW QUALITY PROTEIN: flavo protein [Endogone sp. FLAS-F59071]|nr:LOW QUALITY PROTEIN: flavo protein [Endogone sp. FLAS-F59071]|eukprot:RUS16904.1 LOW QUALITY PROTEIN: flavo protein [Endogone sp. FLAS-F59071]